MFDVIMAWNKNAQTTMSEYMYCPKFCLSLRKRLELCLCAPKRSGINHRENTNEQVGAYSKRQ